MTATIMHFFHNADIVVLGFHHKGEKRKELTEGLSQGVKVDVEL